MQKYILILLTSFLLIGFAGCSKSDDPNVDLCLQQLTDSVRCKAVIPSCDGEQLKTSITCIGITTAKKPCANKTKNPCGYCYLHIDQWDGLCPNKTLNACEYCDEHTSLYNSESE
jgi:hypothetical protein